VHKAVGFSLLGLIALHVSAALLHHFWRRDNTLTAMLPVAAAWRPVGSRADQTCEAHAPPRHNVNSRMPNSAHSLN
jgi:hypothetical protein